MKKLILFIIIAVCLMIGTATAEYKAGWSPQCTAQALNYCKSYYNEDLDKCMDIEFDCGTELFHIVYPKNATEDELWQFKAKLIKLLKKNKVLKVFRAGGKISYCELLSIVKEQWEDK